MAHRVNRRTFLTAAAAIGVAGAVMGCPRNKVRIWRRSGRGRRVSNAALKHAANHLYATQEAALNDPAHPGDNTKIVPLDVSWTRYRELFGFQASVVDLRHV